MIPRISAAPVASPASETAPQTAPAPASAPAAAPEAPARPGAFAQGAAILLGQMEAETARILPLRRETEAAELARLRLEAALEALSPALPREAADALRARLRAARKQTDGPQTAKADGPYGAIMGLLAAWERPVVEVRDAQQHVLDCGYAMKRTYAAQVLKRMTGKGLVQKVAHGQYRIVRTHPELVALRLAALEAALRE
jgi:hypothetical protein